jgi:dienelactone hydrolase
MGERTRVIVAVASLALTVAGVGSSSAAWAAGANGATAPTETAVSIPSDGHQIPGVLALPSADEGPFPAVLMLHGYGSEKNEVGAMYSRLAEALAARGVASLRIDFAGMGESVASTLDYTWDSQISDAATALDRLVSQASIDPARVGVQGFSLGSMVAAHLAGSDPRVAAFGSWSGAIYNGEQSWVIPSIAECEATGEGHLQLDLGWRTLDHSCDFFTSMAASTALDDFAPYANPLLLVVGSADTTVDPAVSGNAATASASGDVTFRMLEGADHIYNVLGEDQALAEQAISTTADWFAEKL